ncbi:MAG: GNAT family N-acetyltransferase [Bacteroidetes bacterium]|nr:GNAT family N-acetyltransferase [Bacteroidota bacterium]
MKITKVVDKQSARQFLDVARKIYRDDPHWICPPDPIIEGIFDPRKNRYFDNGEAQRWILSDDAGNLIGRVAAFYDQEKAKNYDPPTGGMGFFECIHDREAAFLLFETCKDWLESKGMGAMDGPINFGENDNYWGLLVEGFSPPAFGMNYNPPYYKALFEAYGFKPFFEQESKHLDLTKPFPERFWKIAEWVMRKPGYTFEHIRIKDFDKFAKDVVEIHNAAWVFHEHYTPLTIEKVYKSFKEAKPILVEDFIWFVYHEGKPIAFLVMFPDMNQVFKRFNGKLNLINKLRFLYLKHTRLINRARVTIMGVIPKFQGIGIESAIFWHLREPLLVKRPHYHELEISWVGDFNPKMKATLEAIGANPGKIHITYRKLFHQTDHFKKATKVTEVKEKMNQ